VAEMRRIFDRKRIVLGLLLLCLVAVAGYKYWPRSPHWDWSPLIVKPQLQELSENFQTSKSKYEYNDAFSFLRGEISFGFG
jgi:hypothetical protein